MFGLVRGWAVTRARFSGFGLPPLLQLAAGHSVQQVSMDLGYESVSAFITVFKKRLGTTPKRYFAASISSEWGMQNSTSD